MINGNLIGADALLYFHATFEEGDGIRRRCPGIVTRVTVDGHEQFGKRAEEFGDFFQEEMERGQVLVNVTGLAVNVLHLFDVRSGRVELDDQAEVVSGQRLQEERVSHREHDGLNAVIAQFLSSQAELVVVGGRGGGRRQRVAPERSESAEDWISHLGSARRGAARGARWQRRSLQWNNFWCGLALDWCSHSLNWFVCSAAGACFGVATSGV